MIIQNPYLRGYLFGALQETPILLAHVLSGVTDMEVDARVDPDRFTIREAVAHLADWETVYQERFRRVVAEDEPVLPDIDEGLRAEQKEYGETELEEQLNLFQANREETVAFLTALPAEAWERRGLRPEIGQMRLIELVQLLPLHDIYHLKQAREYLKVARYLRA